jgi:translocation and assembly module TamB
VLDDFSLERGELRRDGATALVLTRAALAGEWTQSGIELRSARFVGRNGELSLDARLRPRAPWLEHATGVFDWHAGERRWQGTLASVSEANGILLRGSLTAPLRLTLGGSLSRQVERPWRLKISIPRFDPRRGLMPDSELESLAAELEAHGAGASANIEGHIGIDDGILAIRELGIEFANGEIVARALRVGIADAPGEVRGKARVRFGAQTPQVFAHLTWKSLTLPARWVGQPLATSGQFLFDGNAEHFETRGAVDVARQRFRSSLAWKADGSREVIYLREGRVSQTHGELAIEGALGLAAPRSWRLKAVAHGFDPSGLAPDWPGALDFALNTHGELAPDGAASAVFELSDLRGRVRNRPVSGGGLLMLAPGMRLNGRLHIASGTSSLDVSGAKADTTELNASLNIASLAEWNARLRGRVQMTLSARGRWPATVIDANARGQGMRLDDYAVENLSLRLNVRTPKAPRVDIAIAAGDAALAGMKFDTLTFTGGGTAAGHDLQLRGAGHPLSAELRARGRLVAKRWEGALNVLRLDVDDVPPLALEAPARVRLARNEFAVARTCLAGGDIRLCIAGSNDTHGRLTASYSLRALPLALLAQLAAPGQDIAISGQLDGAGDFTRDLSGALTGKAQLMSPSGAVEQPGQDPPVRLEYRALSLDASITRDTARARVVATLEPDGDVAGNALLGNLRGDNPTLQGKVTVSLRDLSPLEWFLPQLAHVAGSGELAATMGGTLREPAFTAGLAVRQFHSEVPALGIDLTDGEFNARLAADGTLEARAKLNSGTGTLELTGKSASIRKLELAIRGENFLAANIPAAHLTLSPDLTLTGSPRDLMLGGTITIPHAAVDLDKLTNKGGAQISSDVVVIDRQERDARTPLALRTDVKVVLGKNVKLTGFGLDATVDGQVRIHEQPGSPSLGSGEIRLAGTYEAYGRKLAIERGQLLFADTELDNPQLDVLAARKLPDVTARLRITGSARRPQLDVFTEPPSSPTEALSYLVTGKSMDDLHGEDGKRVETAAQGLGGVLGDRLTKRFSGKLGIDSVGVEQSDELGSSAFTVGKYLSPGFFVSYGIGLFEPGTVITLRYEFSDRWSLEATDAPEEQRAGINYRIER